MKREGRNVRLFDPIGYYKWKTGAHEHRHFSSGAIMSKGPAKSINQESDSKIVNLADKIKEINKELTALAPKYFEAKKEISVIKEKLLQLVAGGEIGEIKKIRKSVAEKSQAFNALNLKYDKLSKEAERLEKRFRHLVDKSYFNASLEDCPDQ